MTREEKQLLLKDLCARLPYGVKMLFNNKHEFILSQINPYLFAGKDGYGIIFDFGGKTYSVEDCKPYLRPMYTISSIEEQELEHRTDGDYVDYCCEHHLDYRCLIEKSLALKSPEGMYDKK